MIAFIPKELKLWLHTPHGRGVALCIESFAHDNTIFTVILEETGKIKHYTSEDITACKDYTDGINTSDLKPDRK